MNCDRIPTPLDSATVDGDSRPPAEATLDSIGDAVLSTDHAGRVAYLNRAAEVMTGWSREAAVGRPADDVLRVLDRDTREIAQNPLTLAVRLDRTVSLSGICLLVRPDGREIAIEDSAAPIHDSHGRVTGAVMVFRDVGAALETSRLMAHLAHHDLVTGLPNRLLLLDRLTQAIALERRRRKPLAVLFLDVDGFKTVNDTRGHGAGDLLLQSIAARLSASLRPSDTVSRLGGDEFVVVLAEIEQAEDALLVTKALLHVLAQPYDLNDSPAVCITVSAGVAVCPDHGLDAPTLIAHADAAMYVAKRAGRGQFRLSDVGIDRASRRHLTTSTEECA